MAVNEQLALTERANYHVADRHLVTTVGVRPDVAAKLTPTDVEMLLVFSGSMEDISKWVITDLLNWGERKAARLAAPNTREYWNERDRIWLEILQNCKVEVSKHTAYNMAACGRAWPWERRRQTERISYEHHRLLASKSEAEQEEWMDLVEAGGWSTTRLRAALYSDQDPLAPVMSAPQVVELWPEAKMWEELDRIFAGDLDHPAVDEVADLIETIKGDYEHELSKERQRHFPR